MHAAPPTPVQPSTSTVTSTPVHKTIAPTPRTPKTPAAPVVAQLSNCILKSPEAPVLLSVPSQVVDLSQVQGNVFIL